MKGLKPKSIKVERFHNPFVGIRQYGVLTIDPYTQPTIAWNWASKEMERENGARVVLPFPGHVRYYE